MAARSLRASCGSPRRLSEQALAEAARAPAATVRGDRERRPGRDARRSFARILACARNRDAFRMDRAVDPNYEQSVLRSHAYLAAPRSRRARPPGHRRAHRHRGGQLLPVPLPAGHAARPADPIAWAPDLVLTHERLREDWVARWLTDPGRIYPGTSMPANFPGDPPQYQAIYPELDQRQAAPRRAGVALQLRPGLPRIGRHRLAGRALDRAPVRSRLRRA